LLIALRDVRGAFAHGAWRLALGAWRLASSNHDARRNRGEIAYVQHEMYLPTKNLLIVTISPHILSA